MPSAKKYGNEKEIVTERKSPSWKILRIVSFSISKVPPNRWRVSGNDAMTIKVPSRPEFIVASATGDIAYKALPKIANQMWEVIRLSQIKIAPNKTKGANKKKIGRAHV